MPGPTTGPASKPVVSPGRHRRFLLAVISLVVALLALVAALLLGGGRPATAPGGLPDAGVVTAWGLPVARLLFDVCAVGSVGCLLAGAVLAPGSAAGRLIPVASRAVRAAVWWALAWAGTAAVSLVLTLSDVSGLPAAEVLPSGLFRYTWLLPQTRALLVTLLLAAVVALCARRARTTNGARVSLVLALVALTPTLYTGHSAQGADHATGAAGLVVHVVAASLWIGGLFGLAVHLRGDGPLLARAAARFSVVALGCFTLVVASGLVAAYARLGTSTDAWVSPYGALLGLKATAAVALGAVGWLHRRRALGPLAQGRPGAFVRLAAGELVVMASTVGLAVALSRTPAPLTRPSGDPGPAPPGADVDPVTLAGLVTEWRPDPVTGAVLLVALAGYLRGVSRVTARGHAWPRRRTVATVAAAAVASVALGGGVASYPVSLLSVHLAQYLALALVIPALVTLGAPLALARLARDPDAPPPPGPGRVTLALANPVNGFVALVVLTALLYATPLLASSLASAPAHLASSAAALAVGTAFWWPVLAADDVPGRAPVRERAGLVVGVLVFLSAFAVALAVRDSLFAVWWFAGTGPDGVGPAVDRVRASAVVWGFVLLVAVLALAGRRSPSRSTGVAD